MCSLTAADAPTYSNEQTVAAGDAIHAGICAKDAIVTELTGTTMKGKDHALVARKLRRALGHRPDATSGEKGDARTGLKQGRR